MMTALSPSALNTLFRSARTYNHFLDRPVTDTLLEI